MFGYESWFCLVSAHHFSTSCESAKGPVVFPRLIGLINFISCVLVHRSFNCFSWKKE